MPLISCTSEEYTDNQVIPYSNTDSPPISPKNTDYGSIVGYVTDSQGNPIEGCLIERKGKWPDGEIAIFTGADGFFSHSLHIGEWEIQARCDLNGAERVSEAYDVSIKYDSITELSIVVR
jgi:hypothetical protein